MTRLGLYTCIYGLKGKSLSDSWPLWPPTPTITILVSSPQKIAKFAPTTIPELQAPTIYKNYTSYNLKFVNPTKKNVLPQLKLPGNLHYRKLIRPPLQN